MSSGEQQVRNEAFLENEVQVLTSRVKVLEYDCAELTKHNSELSDRVKKLASRQPAWPKGYRPQKRYNSNQSR
jgi:hypothetical protein